MYTLCCQRTYTHTGAQVRIHEKRLSVMTSGLFTCQHGLEHVTHPTVAATFVSDDLGSAARILIPREAWNLASCPWSLSLSLECTPLIYWILYL